MRFVLLLFFGKFSWKFLRRITIYVSTLSYVSEYNPYSNGNDSKDCKRDNNVANIFHYSGDSVNNDNSDGSSA